MSGYSRQIPLDFSLRQRRNCFCKWLIINYDADLYVRCSVANHLGDIAKDHPKLAFEICERWLAGASGDRKWLIRHSLRHPAKKGVKAALQLRGLAS